MRDMRIPACHIPKEKEARPVIEHSELSEFENFTNGVNICNTPRTAATSRYKDCIRCIIQTKIMDGFY